MIAFCLHTVPQILGPVVDRFLNHGQVNFYHCIQSEPVVSQYFGISWHRHVPPALTTIYIIVQWIEVSAGGGPVFRFDEIWDTLLQPFLHFFLLYERLQNPAESITYLCL